VSNSLTHSPILTVHSHVSGIFANENGWRDRVEVISAIYTGSWQQMSGCRDGKLKFPESESQWVKANSRGVNKDPDVQFIPPDEVRPRKKRKKKDKMRTHMRPRTRWPARWILAFPVFVEDPSHWTLGILVNKSYGTAVPDWSVFHFNSLLLENEVQSDQRCLDFAHFILSESLSNEVTLFNIPVPSQKGMSNDCGLWGAHYLRIFLEDADKFIKYCSSVGFLTKVESLPLR
jgi:hypothetical protein